MTTKDIFGLEMVSLHGMPTASQVLQGCGVNWVSFPYFISIFYFLSCVGSVHSSVVTVVEFHSEVGEIQKVLHPNEPPKRIF